VLPARQSELLLLAAIAERPVGADDVTGFHGKRSLDDLVELERHGMLRTSGSGWSISHDTIAEGVIARSSPESRRVAHLCLASSTLSGTPDSAALKIAMEHFCEAGAVPEQRNVARTWITLHRANRDVRRVDDLLTELLGPSCDERILTDLRQSLPRTMRRPPLRRMIALPAALVLLAMGVAAAALLKSDPPDAEMVLIEAGANNGAIDRVYPFRHRDWEGKRAEAPLEVGGGSRSIWRSDSLESRPVPNALFSEWVLSRSDTGSNGPTELFLRAGGKDRILSPAAGDDVNPVWSPDGSAVVFTTTRYPDGGGTFDLAIYDVTTGQLRRLTATADIESSPKWSPDGTRIAFARRTVTPGPDQFCWIAFDGTSERCMQVTTGQFRDVAGWINSDEILVVTDGPQTGRSNLHRLDLRNGATVELGFEREDEIDLSPDGQWVAGLYRLPTKQRRLFAFPIDQPARSRAVLLGQAEVLSWYWRGSIRRPWLAKLRIYPDRDTVFAPTPVQFAVEGESSTGGAIDVPQAVVRWTSSDDGVASIDSNGRLEPRHDGAVTITASAGGWRRATINLKIVSGATQVVMNESWSAGWLARWEPYGYPPAKLAVSADGKPGLLVNGDSNDTSGAFSRTTFDPGHGLALEALVTTPVTRSWWQKLSIGVMTLSEKAWDGGNRVGGGCTFQYPAQEGGNGLKMAGMGGSVAAIDPILASGRWYRVRVQLFPDGTCGFAINGRFLYRGTGRQPVNARYSVRLGGQTYHSLLLVGPLTVWEGVPGGVDWSIRGNPPP
jgi:hypothetical protein